MLLFSFTPSDALTFPAEADVHGLWQDDSTFVITTTLDVSTAGLKFGETQVEKLEIGTTAELYTSGLLVNGTQQCDVQPPQVSSACQWHARAHQMCRVWLASPSRTATISTRCSLWGMSSI